MSISSPATRAALAVFILATVLLATAASLLITNRSRTAVESEKQRLVALSASIAALVDGLEELPNPAMNARLADIAEENKLGGVAILHRRGRILAANDPSGLDQVNWSIVLEETGNSGAPRTVVWDGKEYFMAVRPSVSGENALVLRSLDAINEAAKRHTGAIILGALAIWLLLGIALAALANYAGNRSAQRMEDLVRLLAKSDRFDEEAMDHQLDTARKSLGVLTEPFETVASCIRAQQTKNAEARSHIAALFQINPHYVLLCTLDGHIVDANPAFYAMTGLPFEAVRGQRIEVLNEVMPVEPLFELARRSLRESTSISGIEYALVNRDDVRRAVQVSLRAITIEEKPGVLIQATDVANQRNLERQISTFSDALDLMVDQRVAQLTAGNTSVNKLLDDAGVVFVTFDAGGGTRRWNRAAEDLTGRTIHQVPHFIAFASILDLSVEEKDRFNAWFWGASEGSFTMEVQSAEGLVRRMLWRRSTNEEAGSAEQRVLLGMDLPRLASHSGDGIGTYVPGINTVNSPL